LQVYVDTAMRLYVIVCALFQVKSRNINVYVLLTCGLSKLLGDHQSQTFLKTCIQTILKTNRHWNNPPVLPLE